MTRHRPTPHPFAALTLAAALLCPAAASAQDEPAYTTAKAEEGGFEAQVTVTGRFAADVLAELRYDAQRYAGELEVAEVMVTHGRVSSGQPVLRLEAPDLEDALADARDALDKADLKLAWARKQAQITDAEQQVAAKRRELEWADLESDYERWESFGKDDAYTQARLTMQRQEDRHADEAQELKQLEQLYKNAKLASRTQDVVLERARRDLEVSKTYLEIARRAHKVQMDVTLPRRERDWDNRVRWTEMQHAHAAWQAEVAQQQQVWAVQSAQDALELAQEAVAELERDAAALTIKAQAGGVLSALGLEVGDKVSAGQTFATLYDPAKGTIDAELSAEDLRVVQEGDAVQITWVPFGEIESAGTVQRIAWQGKAGGAGQTSYALAVDVDNVAPMIRPGMAADLRVARPMENSTLSVPADAVATDDRGAYCMVKRGDDFVRREVVAGASNATRTQIIKGLSAGETVRVPAK